jgi:hypothetical protein
MLVFPSCHVDFYHKLLISTREGESNPIYLPNLNNRAESNCISSQDGNYPRMSFILP